MSAVRRQPRVVMAKSLTLACNNTLNLQSLVQPFNPHALLLASQTARLVSNAETGFQPLSLARSQSQKLARSIEQQFSVHAFSSEVEAFKAKTLAKLATAPYKLDVKLAPVIQQKLAEFQHAKTLADARAVQLDQVIESGHQQFFIATLTTAVAQAARNIGFTSVESSLGPNGAQHIVATDAAGRSLVSEITNTDEPSLSTEVVGVTDSSCDKLLRDFEVSLEEQGVRGPSERKFNGGVLQLAATKDFANRKLKPASGAPVTPQHSHHHAEQRAQRLNQRRKQRH